MQNTFYWMLPTFGCCFHIGKAEWLKKKMLVCQKYIYRWASEKIISQKGLLTFFHFISFLLFVQIVLAFLLILHFDRILSWAKKLSQKQWVKYQKYSNYSKCSATQMLWWAAKIHIFSITRLLNGPKCF